MVNYRKHSAATSLIMNGRENTDCWTVEFKYENSQDEWAPCGPMTTDLEEAASWMGTCSKIYTDMLVREDNGNNYAPIIGTSPTGNYKTVKCMFRLRNLNTDEIIPGEVFAEA